MIKYFDVVKIGVEGRKSVENQIKDDQLLYTQIARAY
jgi:hypothetical protein